jgi:hypothetical protein
MPNWTMLPPDSRRQRLQQSVDWAAEPELELELELEVELERELLEEDEVVCCSGLAAGLLAARVCNWSIEEVSSEAMWCSGDNCREASSGW